MLSEFGLDTVILIADGDGNLVREVSVEDLLPGAFRPDDLILGG